MNTGSCSSFLPVYRGNVRYIKYSLKLIHNTDDIDSWSSFDLLSSYGFARYPVFLGLLRSNKNLEFQPSAEAQIN